MMTTVMSQQKSSKRLWWGAEWRGGGVEWLEVKEVVQTTIHNEGKDPRVLRSAATLE